MILPRNWSTIYIINKDDGEIVWEYTGDYHGGLSGGDESHMIAPGLPGAGNVLVLDNGRGRDETFILEVNPSSKEVEWVFDIGEEFNTRTAGSVQRLPNGNTLISEDMPGRVFEVTRDKQIVWEFKRTKYDGMMRINRAYRYPIDFAPQFKSLQEAG